MGDYGFRVCTVCGGDVLWEEAVYMKGEIVCCSEGCHDVYRSSTNADGSTVELPDKPTEGK